jgi:hypothetical protein
MTFAIREVGVMERSDLAETLRLSGWLEAQEKASRAAGFVEIARLCETVNECLAGLRRGERPVLVPMIGTLMEVCRTVRLHAETVAGRLRHGPRAAGPHWDDEDAGERPGESRNARALPLPPLDTPSNPNVPSA